MMIYQIGRQITRMRRETNMNRSLRAIKFLSQADDKTLTMYQLNRLLKTNWSPRAISEARRDGAKIKGDNPYTLEE
jgi:hypothetical protein